VARNLERPGGSAIDARTEDPRYKPSQDQIIVIPSVDDGRKRVIGIMVAILASLHMRTVRMPCLVDRRPEARH
jgi:hypothetical protein